MALPHGFSGEIHYHFEENNVDRWRTAFATPYVPEGEIWIITEIATSAQHKNTTITHTAGPYGEQQIIDTITEPPPPVSLNWSGTIALVLNEHIEIIIHNLATPVDLLADVWGYKITL